MSIDPNPVSFQCIVLALQRHTDLSMDKITMALAYLGMACPRRIPGPDWLVGHGAHWFVARVGTGWVWITTKGRPFGNRWPYREENFFRLDRSDDKEFYAEPRSDTEDNSWVRAPFIDRHPRYLEATKHGVL